MKSARDRAIDIAYGIMGQGFSREMFLKVATDTGDTGKIIARMIDVAEIHITADRESIRKAQAPS